MHDKYVTSSITVLKAGICMGINKCTQGGPKKVSHYRESSLNRIKNRQSG